MRMKGEKMNVKKLLALLALVSFTGLSYASENIDLKKDESGAEETVGEVESGIELEEEEGKEHPIKLKDESKKPEHIKLKDETMAPRD